MPNLNKYLEQVGRMLHETPNISAETVALRLLNAYTNSWSFGKHHRGLADVLIGLLQNNSNPVEQDEKKAENPPSLLAQKLNTLKTIKDCRQDGDMCRLLQAVFMFFPKAKRELNVDLREKFSATLPELFEQEKDRAYSNAASKKSGFYPALFCLHYVRLNSQANDPEFEKSLSAKARKYLESQRDSRWDNELSDEGLWVDRYDDLCDFDKDFKNKFKRLYYAFWQAVRDDQNLSHYTKADALRVMRDVEINPALFKDVFIKEFSGEPNRNKLSNMLLHGNENNFYLKIFLVTMLLKCCILAEIYDEALFGIIGNFLNEIFCRVKSEDSKLIAQIVYLFTLLPEEILQKLAEKNSEHLKNMVQGLFEKPLSLEDHPYVIKAFSKWLDLHSSNVKLDIPFAKLTKGLLVELLQACGKQQNAGKGKYYSEKILAALESHCNNAQQSEEKANEKEVEKNLQSMLSWLKTAEDEKQIGSAVKIITYHIEQYTKDNPHERLSQNICLFRTLQANQNVNVQIKNLVFEKLKGIRELPNDVGAEIILQAAILFSDDEKLKNRCLSALENALKNDALAYKDPNKEIYEILSQAVIPPFLAEMALRFVLYGIEKKHPDRRFHYYEPRSNFIDGKIISNDIFLKIVLNIFKTYPEQKNYYLFYFMPYGLTPRDEESKFRWQLFRLEVFEKDQKLLGPKVELMNTKQQEYPKCLYG